MKKKNPEIGLTEAEMREYWKQIQEKASDEEKEAETVDLLLYFKADDEKEKCRESCIPDPLDPTIKYYLRGRIRMNVPSYYIQFPKVFYSIPDEFELQLYGYIQANEEFAQLYNNMASGLEAMITKRGGYRKSQTVRIKILEDY